MTEITSAKSNDEAPEAVPIATDTTDATTSKTVVGEPWEPISVPEATVVATDKARLVELCFRGESRSLRLEVPTLDCVRHRLRSAFGDDAVIFAALYALKDDDARMAELASDRDVELAMNEIHPTKIVALPAADAYKVGDEQPPPSEAESRAAASGESLRWTPPVATTPAPDAPRGSEDKQPPPPPISDFVHSPPPPRWVDWAFRRPPSPLGCHRPPPPRGPLCRLGGWAANEDGRVPKIKEWVRWAVGRQTCEDRLRARGWWP